MKNKKTILNFMGEKYEFSYDGEQPDLSDEDIKQIREQRPAIIHNNTKTKRCSECGSTKLQPAGTCMICTGCGATIGACGV